jgi:hypothetical protein
VRPHCLERILGEGIQFPQDMFRARVLATTQQLAQQQQQQQLQQAK